MPKIIKQQLRTAPYQTDNTPYQTDNTHYQTTNSLPTQVDDEELAKLQAWHTSMTNDRIAFEKMMADYRSQQQASNIPSTSQQYSPIKLRRIA